MRDIPGFEGRYAATKKGLIWSRIQNRFLNLGSSGSLGYYQVRLYVLGYGKRKYFVHRLIAQTYIPNPKKLPCINHKDFDRKNNNVHNLEWCTKGDNIRYTASLNRHYHGERHHKSKLNYQLAEEIRLESLIGISGRKLAKQYGVKPGTIQAILHRKTWKSAN